jgi:hypothetical protein
LRLEDPLWRDQRNALAFEQKAFRILKNGDFFSLALKSGPLVPGSALLAC